MKKQALVVVTLMPMLFSLQAMQYVASELKIAWSYPLVRLTYEFEIKPGDTVLRYHNIRSDGSATCIAATMDVERQGNKLEVQLAVCEGEKLQDKDENVVYSLDQVCKKSEQGSTSTWHFNHVYYDTYMSIPLDLWNHHYSYCGFRSRRFIWDKQNCLALALIDRYMRPTNSIEKAWYLCSAHIPYHFSTQSIEVKLLKKLPISDIHVLEARILPGGKKMIFFLANGTIVTISPDEVQAPRMLGTRCVNLADLLFKFV